MTINIMVATTSDRQMEKQVARSPPRDEEEPRRYVFTEEGRLGLEFEETVYP